MICNPSIKHGPHTMQRGPHAGETCTGVTATMLQAQGIRKKEALATRAHTFVTRYGIDVSVASLRANPRIWEQVEKALERQYVRGLQEGRGQAK